MQRHTLDLPNRLDGAQASRLLSQLLAARGRDVAIDAGEVEQVGALCAQVLLSAERTWRSDRKEFTIDRSSASFRRAMEALGLAGCLSTARASQ